MGSSSPSVVLLLDALTRPSQLMVNESTGQDRSLCGFDVFHCNTLLDAVQRQDWKEKDVLILDPNVDDAPKKWGVQAARISGDGSLQTLPSLTVPTHAVFALSADATFTNLKFSLPPSLSVPSPSPSTPSLFSSSASSLTLSLILSIILLLSPLE